MNLNTASPGTIRVAQHDGVFVIKMQGDVRLTLCLSFDQFIENMLSGPDFCTVVFDLTDAQAIDSTTLGLMAKISIRGRALGFADPLVITSNPSITRLLVSMGFEDIFTLVTDAVFAHPSMDSDDCVLQADCMSEDEVQCRVIEAHRILMDLNEKNRNTFRELVETLESK